MDRAPDPSRRARLPDGAEALAAAHRRGRRPSARTIGKRILWVAPAILVAVLLLLGLGLRTAPPRDDQTVVMVLVMVMIAELAWLVAWSVDRQIEIARKMTVRIAPVRLLRVTLPLLVTIAITLAIAFARPRRRPRRPG